MIASAPASASPTRNTERVSISGNITSPHTTAATVPVISVRRRPTRSDTTAETTVPAAMNTTPIMVSASIVVLGICSVPVP